MATKVFDYAFEDIDLIRKALDALRRVASNTTAYRQAICDLQLLETVLRGVQHVSFTNASEDTVSNLLHCDHFCRSPLDHFLRKLRALEPDIRHTSASSPAPVWATRLVEEVVLLQNRIGRGLRVIDALLSVEELQQDIASNARLPAQMQQIIGSLQEHLSTPFEGRAGRGHGHYYNNIQTSGNAYSHIGDRYFLNVTPAASVDDLSKRLDATASTHQAEQLLSLVKDIKAMLPRGPGHNEEMDVQNSADSSLQLSGSRSALPFDKMQAELFLRCLFETLGAALNAVLLMLMWTVPAMRYCGRALATIPRPPSGSLDSNTTFVDALDRKFSLQYEQFRYWPVVSAWLQCQFQDRPGALRVSQKRFAVFKDMKPTGRGAMIPFDKWERMITPGQRVLMSMYTGYHNPAQGNWPLRNVCPSCGFVDPHSHRASIWTKCADCGQLFLLHNLEHIDSPLTHDYLEPNLALGCDQPDIFDCKEIPIFRHVHDLQQPRGIDQDGNEARTSAMPRQWYDDIEARIGNTEKDEHSPMLRKITSRHRPTFRILHFVGSTMSQ